MYQYHDMNEIDFETLAVEICKEILGQATQGFANGPDGGRDGKFVGNANEYPSRSKPWKGTTIIQDNSQNVSSSSQPLVLPTPAIAPGNGGAALPTGG